ncbi:MAG: galactokinase family protein [Opitutaceae bacterium]|nr:galactokinase family protein [Opitutaceae bacterium]
MTEESITRLFAKRFGRAPEVIARAPGRVEFIGNHTDYNGGSVLGAAINRYVWVAIASSGQQRMQLVSGEEGTIVETVPGGIDTRATGPDDWINYPLAVWKSLAEFGLPRPTAFDLLVVSDLPVGAGLSSSAALELAAALCFLELMGCADLAPHRLAALARHAENVHVGVPCGILDQGTCAIAAKDELVHINSRGPTFTRVRIPGMARLWVFNTSEKHALVDGRYAERHRECVAAARKLEVECLAAIPVKNLNRMLKRLPATLAKRVAHIVEENARVAETVTALQSGDLSVAGRCMTASHRSSQILFENSTPALDSLVWTLTKHPHVHGARLTGGGFGGAVLALTDEKFTDADADTVASHHAAFGYLRPQALDLLTADGARVIWRDTFRRNTRLRD